MHENRCTLIVIVFTTSLDHYTSVGAEDGRSGADVYGDS